MRCRAGRELLSPSTFPWATSATALFDAVGRTWLASEIAIIGAASAHNLGYVKHPGCSAFGPDAHPAELLAQTRQHSTHVEWWRRQLDTAEDELAKAEWALALMAVASGEVFGALAQDWHGVVGALSESRRTVLQQAFARTAVVHKSLRQRNRGTWEVIETSDSTGSPASSDTTGDYTADVATVAAERQTPLLRAARDGCWFKVDSTPSYR